MFIAIISMEMTIRFGWALLAQNECVFFHFFFVVFDKFWFKISECLLLQFEIKLMNLVFYSIHYLCVFFVKLIRSFHLDDSLNGLHSLTTRLIQFICFVLFFIEQHIKSTLFTIFCNFMCTIQLNQDSNMIECHSVRFPLMIAAIFDWKSTFARTLPHNLIANVCILLILHNDCVRYCWPLFIIQREL